MWLEQHQMAYCFHDLRVDGLTETQLQHFMEKSNWDKLLNKASTSWRQLSPEQQSELTEIKVKALMLATPTLIKRPVLDLGNEILIGFKPEIYSAKFR